MRIVEVIADAGHWDTVREIATQHGVRQAWCGAAGEDGRCTMSLLVAPDARQAVLDALQGLLSGSDQAQILVLPVEAVLPRIEDPEAKAKSSSGTSREELYDDIAGGARADTNFMILVGLSTLVAAIGLVENNVAVIIGAMVIAPLLGPNLALALATALGDLELMWSALKANLAGVSLAFVLSVLVGVAWPHDVLSDELLARTFVGLDSVALALASGAAAVLSLTTGVSTVLVGVMVAVALLPPTAATGILLGAGHWPEAFGAALLVAVNVVCVNLAAKLVFLARGVRPRTWLERRKARQSLTIYLLLWVLSLAVLVAVIVIRNPALLALPM